MSEMMIQIDKVSKEYRLGQIGGTTLRDELQRSRARHRGLDDPTKRIGSREYTDGETYLALDRVSLTVNKGERLGIIGPNGAGKSTLLKLISQITAPTEGTIGLNGRVASMLEVGTGFHGELTGRENIYMNGAILGMTKKEIIAKIEDIIDFSECRRFIDTPVKRYSSGMYVKLAFAVAAHLDSEIMIMDEVLAVGDVNYQQKCFEKMRSAAEDEGRTVIYVSHNMNTIRRLCNRCIVLKYGKIVYDGNVEEAISIYMGDNDEVPSRYYNLRDRERTSVRPSGRITFTGVEIVNDVPMKLRDKMRLKVMWENHDPEIRQVYIRIYIDGSKGNAAVAVSKPFDTCFGEEHSGIIDLDTSVTGPGNYSVTLQFIQPEILLHDSVRAFGFSILNDPKETGLNFWYSDWGNTLLPGIEYTEL